MWCLAWLYAQFRTYICHVFCIGDWSPPGGLGWESRRIENEDLSREFGSPSPGQCWELEVNCHGWWSELSEPWLWPEQCFDSTCHISCVCWLVSWELSTNVGCWSSLVSLRCGCSICLADQRSSWGNSVHTYSLHGDESSPCAVDDCLLYANFNNYVLFAECLWLYCSRNAGYSRRMQFGKTNSLGDCWASHVIHMYSIQTGSTQLLPDSGPPRMCHTVSFSYKCRGDQIGSFQTTSVIIATLNYKWPKSQSCSVCRPALGRQSAAFKKYDFREQKGKQALWKFS